MNTSFTSLFTVEVHHEYCGGIWDDVDYVVSPATQKTLDGLGWHVRLHEGMLTVFGPLGQRTPRAAVHLKFGLRSGNSRFANFTKLPARDAQDQTQVLVFRVPPDAERNMGAESIRLESQVQSFRSDLTVASAALDHAMTGPLPARRLRARVEDLKDDLTFFYLHSVFALLHLSLPADRIATAPPEGYSFIAALAAREQHLIFRIQATRYSDEDLRSLSIAEVDFDQDGRTEALRFNVDSPTPAHLDASTKLLTFRSESPVPLRRRQPSKFQLRKNGEILISSLRRPGEAHPDNIVFVALSRA